MEFEFSSHAQEMLKERHISEDWVWNTLSAPDTQKMGADNNSHYFKSIEKNEGRVLHVVVNSRVSPKRVVTVFFDRKAGR